MTCEIVRLDKVTPPILDMQATWCNTHRRREVDCLRAEVERLKDAYVEAQDRAHYAELQIDALKRDLHLAKEISRRLTKGETTVQDAAFWQKTARFNMDRANKLDEWLRVNAYKVWELARIEGVISVAVGGAEKRNSETERLIEVERALNAEVRCDCGVPGCNKLYDHRK